MLHLLCTPQVYQRLQKLNLTMSHPSLVRLIDKVGEDYDAKVKGWRDAIVANLASSQTEVKNDWGYVFIMNMYLML